MVLKIYTRKHNDSKSVLDYGHHHKDMQKQILNRNDHLSLIDDIQIEVLTNSLELENFHQVSLFSNTYKRHINHDNLHLMKK